MMTKAIIIVPQNCAHLNFVTVDGSALAGELPFFEQSNL